MTQLPLLPLPLLPLPPLPVVNLPPVRSPWFPMSKPPWEPGWYEVANGDPDCIPVMCYCKVRKGDTLYVFECDWQGLPEGAVEWRGLAAPVNSAG